MSNDLLQMAAQLFMQHLGGQGSGGEASSLNLETVMGSLAKLLPTNGGQLDVQQLVSQFLGNGGGLATLAQSWLGDGENASFSASDLMNVLGSEKVSQFASQLGISTETAAGSLSDMIPELIDKASSGGNLQENLMGAASGILGKLF